jgi:peptidyl-prolyl cis-trans isomerase A (cyclophilin A)
MTSLRRIAFAALATLAIAPAALAAKYATMTTTLGTIVIELEDEKAPISVENFLTYAKDGFYEGTVFHRVIPDFMIQGGGFDHHGNYPGGLHQKGAGHGIRPAIANEWRNGLANTRGTLAMARLGGQADSATSQFFINLKDNDFLDQPRDGAGYAVFGKVIGGMQVVDAIATVPTTRLPSGMGDVPAIEVRIESVRVLPESEVKDAIKAADDAKVDTSSFERQLAEAELRQAEAKIAQLEQLLAQARADAEAARRKLEGAKKGAGE